MAEGKPDFAAIYRPNRPYEKTAFDSSAFDYTQFIELVTRALSTFDHGLVIGIDAPWGHGKSYFGRNFASHLNGSGWRTAYIDAFEHDYVEDPFLLLASTIISDVAPAKSKTSFVKAASNVGKTLLPIAAKAAVRIGTLAAVDAEDLEEVKKAITDAGGEAAQKLVEKRLQDFAKEKASIEEFRKQLTKLADRIKEETTHPLVIFIDELDRCQPTFAVRMLERMKHFFDVPHLSFVMLLNRTQLELAVNGVYGQGVDSATYLTKFIHFFIPLPRRAGVRGGRETQVRRYVQYLGKKISVGEQQPLINEFVKFMSEMASPLCLSMRDVERAFTQFVLAILGRRVSPELVGLMVFVIALRVVAPRVYQGIIDKDDDSVASAIKLLNTAKSSGLQEHLARLYNDMVIAHVRGDEKIGTDSPLKKMLFRFDLEPARTFPFFAELLDQIPDG